MTKYKDIAGQKFGRLTALYKLHNHHDKDHTYWSCVCDCGNLTETRSDRLRTGRVQSCGCLHKKHGKSNTRLYHIWRQIKTRCYNKNNRDYTTYGGRGIKMCDEWRDNFNTFYDWAIENDYKENLTIDRIDVNNNYEPDNCRWATKKQQSRNKRDTLYYTVNGEQRSLKEWCELYKINYNKVYCRIHRDNWSIERALGLEVK